MFRKLMRSVLCLALALMLPMAALADTRHTLTIVPGEELLTEPAFADLFDALSFTATVGEKAAGLTLSVADENIATVAMSADATGLYVQSDLLGDDVFYVSWDDGFAFITEMMKSSLEGAAEGGAEVDEAQLEAIEQMMDAYKTQIVSTLGAAAAEPAAATREEAMKIMNEMFKDDPAMIAFYEGLLDRIVTEEGDFADEGRDTATRRDQMVMTGDDLAAVCDTKYMRTMLESALRAEEPDLEEAELLAEVDEMLDEMRRLYKESDINMTVNAYTIDEGQTLVGMDMGMEMSITEDDETETVAMNMNYDRLTTTDGVSHKADMSMAANDEQMAQMLFELNSGANGVSTGSLAMLADDAEITFLYDGKNEGNDRVRTLSVYLREPATAIIPPAAADRPVMSFVLTSGEADESVLAGVEAATPDNAVNVMKLSMEDMQELLTEVQSRVMQAVFTAMGKLPASVIELLMGPMEDAADAA